MTIEFIVLIGFISFPMIIGLALYNATGKWYYIILGIMATVIWAHIILNISG